MSLEVRRQGRRSPARGVLTVLRTIIFIVAVIAIPLGIYVASTYGSLEEVTFLEAVQKAESTTEGDQAPKVIVRVTIDDPNDVAQPDGGEQSPIRAHDASGRSFHISFTGTPPDVPFTSGQALRFVGHVHGGPTGYFHATQVYQ